jgi:sortase A
MSVVDRLVERIIEALARRPHARGGLTALAVVMIAAALGMISYPVVTDLYHDSLQGRLARQLASPATRSAYLDGTLRDGQSLTRLQIPRLGVDVIVVQGDDDASLRAGAGHYPETPLPCQAGDVAIAGHRTTYGKPFANIDRLRPGDAITLTTPVGTCTYRVSEAPFDVLPDDWSAVAPTPGRHELTLTACDPKGSASHRIVVKALMVSSTSQL